MTPPAVIDGARVLAYAIVDQDCKPTRAVRHYVNQQLCDPAKSLVIVKYGREDSYYLFYCDDHWECVNDTLHASLEEAKRQAEREYQGITAKWRDLSP